MSKVIGIVFVCVHIACPLLLNRYIHGFLFLDIHESNTMENSWKSHLLPGNCLRRCECHCWNTTPPATGS